MNNVTLMMLSKSKEQQLDFDSQNNQVLSAGRNGNNDSIKKQLNSFSIQDVKTERSFSPQQFSGTQQDENTQMDQYFIKNIRSQHRIMSIIESMKQGRQSPIYQSNNLNKTKFQRANSTRTLSCLDLNSNNDNQMNVIPKGLTDGPIANNTDLLNYLQGDYTISTKSDNINLNQILNHLQRQRSIDSGLGSIKNSNHQVPPVMNNNLANLQQMNNFSLNNNNNYNNNSVNNSNALSNALKALQDKVKSLENENKILSVCQEEQIKQILNQHQQQVESFENQIQENENIENELRTQISILENDNRSLSSRVDKLIIENQNFQITRADKDQLVQSLEEQALLVNNEISLVRENMIEFQSSYQREKQEKQELVQRFKTEQEIQYKSEEEIQVLKQEIEFMQSNHREVLREQDIEIQSVRQSFSMHIIELEKENFLKQQSLGQKCQNLASEIIRLTQFIKQQQKERALQIESQQVLRTSPSPIQKNSAQNKLSTSRSPGRNSGQITDFQLSNKKTQQQSSQQCQTQRQNDKKEQQDVFLLENINQILSENSSSYGSKLLKSGSKKSEQTVTDHFTAPKTPRVFKENGYPQRFQSDKQKKNIQKYQFENNIKPNTRLVETSIQKDSLNKHINNSTDKFSAQQRDQIAEFENQMMNGIQKKKESILSNQVSSGKESGGVFKDVTSLYYNNSEQNQNSGLALGDLMGHDRSQWEDFEKIYNQTYGQTNEDNNINKQTKKADNFYQDKSQEKEKQFTLMDLESSSSKQQESKFSERIELEIIMRLIMQSEQRTLDMSQIYHSLISANQNLKDPNHQIEIRNKLLEITQLMRKNQQRLHYLKRQQSNLLDLMEKKKSILKD